MKVPSRTIHDNVIIRSAQPDDALTIQHLYSLLVPDHPGIRVEPERLATIADDPNSLLLVVEYDAEVVATAFLALCLDPMFGRQPFAILENVVVDSAHRKRGCGKAMLDVIDHVAFEANCSKIMLQSDQSRTAAHNFFSSMGYNKEAKRGFVKYRRQILPSKIDELPS